LTLGYYDKARFTGPIGWNDVKLKHYYGVKLDDIKINGKPTGVCKDRECLVMVDSGASYLSIP